MTARTTGDAALGAEWFEAAVEPHRSKLLRQALRMTRDREGAEDLLQDTLERGFRKRALFQPGTDVCAWLLSIMRNVWISRFRSTVSRPSTVSLDAVTEESLHLLAAPGASVVEASVIDGLDTSEILGVIALLPPHFREVVMLADVRETPYRDIAEGLQIPVGSVCSRLSRARERLRRTLRDGGFDLAELARAG
jgi:RNA polymerase sigma-70 factor (ECF subfamily)